MPVFPLPQSAPCDLQLRLLLYSFSSITTWSFSDLSNLYWRLYWNPQPGAFVTLNQKTFVLTPETVFIIPPDTPFATALHRPVDHFFIHFTLSTAYRTFPAGIYPFDLSDTMQKQLGVLCDHLSKGTTGSFQDIDALSIVSNTLRRLPPSLWPTAPLDPRVIHTIDLLNTLPAKQPSNSELAAQINMSTNGFIRLFSHQTGASPRAYGLRLRLDHASHLLIHTDQKIEDIAEKCGFWDRNYFTKMFRKYRFISPGEFRRQRVVGAL